MTSVPEARRAVSAPGKPHQTIPAPARMAAWLTNIGAPLAVAEAWLLVHADLQRVARVRAVMDAIIEITRVDAASLRGEADL